MPQDRFDIPRTDVDFLACYRYVTDAQVGWGNAIGSLLSSADQLHALSCIPGLGVCLRRGDPFEAAYHLWWVASKAGALAEVTAVLTAEIASRLDTYRKFVGPV